MYNYQDVCSTLVGKKVFLVLRHALLAITSAVLLPLPGLGRWLLSCPSAAEHTQLLCVNHRPCSSVWRPTPNTLLAFLSRKSCFGCPLMDSTFQY